MHWPDSWKHSAVGHVLVSHAVKQVQWWRQAVSQRNAVVRWIIVTQRPQACYSMINHSTVTYLFKTKQMWNHIQWSKLCSQWAWVDVVVPVLEDLFIEGGWYRQESKRRRGGWGLTGVSVGIWGWATVEHPPRYCLLCQAESVFFQEAGGNLSTSTNTLRLPTPDNPTNPPLTVGAFLLVHRRMEIFEACVKWWDTLSSVCNI